MDFVLEYAPAAAITELNALLVELHRHESAVSPSLGDAAARDDDDYLQLYRSRFREWFVEGSGFLLIAREARDDGGGGEPLGFLFAVEKQGDTAYGTGERIGYIEEIAVLERARGLGVGRALIEQARRRFTERGIDFIKLSTVPGNDDARSFYEKLGFRPAAQLLIGKA